MWGCPALHYQEHPEVENERSAGYCGQYPPALEGQDNSLCHRPVAVNLPARLIALSGEVFTVRFLAGLTTCNP